MSEELAKWYIRGVQGDHPRYMLASTVCKHFLIFSQETYGEDPYLSGELAKWYISGVQGDHPRYMRASTVCKHFDVHTGPENIPSSRFSFDSKVNFYIENQVKKVSSQIRMNNGF